jgi:peptidoglycan/xylan/chitin deacetylase (PgdA/CDA1 family)
MWPGVRIRIVALAVAVVAAPVSAGGSTRHATAPTAVVNGLVVPIRGAHPTVATLLRATQRRPPPGLRLSMVSHRVITDRDPTVAPVILVDRHPAVASTPVRAGQRIVVTQGTAIEPTVVSSVRLSADVTATPSVGLPDVERFLWHPGSLPRQPELVGALSGEVVLMAPVTPTTAAQLETGKVVALTFDDGPDATWTPQVLRTLAAEGVPATFCDIGRSASAHPDLVRDEVAQGETLCDHTVDHDTTLDHASHERVAFEVDRGADLIDAASGVRPRFYRPPAGVLSPDVIATAHGQGLRVLTWSVDPSDYLVPLPDVLLSRILSQVRPGAVILLHDGGGFRANTVGILASLIDTLRSEGYRFTTPAQETPD